MDDQLKKIIQSSNFKILDGIFVYVKVNSIPSGEHFMVTRDTDEITVVTKENKLGELDIIERNKDDYRLIALNVSVPFYSVGFLSTVSSAIAKEGMNVLIVSTYSKDYIMVREDKLNKAREVLVSLGFQETV